MAAILLAFESGATGIMATVRAGPTYWRVHVFGTDGWAEARDETRLTVAPLGEEPRTRTLPAADSLAILLEAFADAIEGGKPFPVSTREMLDTEFESEHHRKFRVNRSMRDVEPSVNLFLKDLSGADVSGPA